MPNVGDIVKAITADVIGNDSAIKYHLCVCSVNNYYLYICGRPRPGDFPISVNEITEYTTDVELVEAISHISLSRVMQVPRFKRSQQASVIGACHDGVLVRLVRHVNDSPVIAPRDKARITEGIARHLNERNA
jgi:hypothetical protein